MKYEELVKINDDMWKRVYEKIDHLALGILTNCDCAQCKHYQQESKNEDECD